MAGWPVAAVSSLSSAVHREASYWVQQDSQKVCQITATFPSVDSATAVLLIYTDKSPKYPKENPFFFFSSFVFFNHNSREIISFRVSRIHVAVHKRLFSSWLSNHEVCILPFSALRWAAPGWGEGSWSLGFGEGSNPSKIRPKGPDSCLCGLFPCSHFSPGSSQLGSWKCFLAAAYAKLLQTNSPGLFPSPAPHPRHGSKSSRWLAWAPPPRKMGSCSRVECSP